VTAVAPVQVAEIGRDRAVAATWAACAPGSPTDPSRGVLVASAHPTAGAAIANAIPSLETRR